ncbi:MAG TPA: hypothetical protein VJP89_02615 [Pyrinomonadaceae bacterium]|nr:hypothetical protein [Pyrinomonadaceae bacterium]
MTQSFFLLASVIAVLMAAAIPGQAQDKKMDERVDLKYKVGQKWSYQARAGEEDSYLIIVKIDKDTKLGNIIHIALSGLKIKNRRSPDGISDQINHMPFSEVALNKSGLKLLKEKIDLPDFEEGYQIWRKDFDAGRAGIYSITVAEAVKVMETALNQ